MRKTYRNFLLFLFLAVGFINYKALAQTTYTVQPGDSMWKIAVKYEVGVSEIISKNPQIKNPALIYPGQKINIPSVDTSIKAKENEVVRLVNLERSKAGLAPLAINWEVSRVARYKSQDMINKNYFSHESPTYGSPFKMMETFGIRFTAAGENIAMGQQTPAQVMNGWMNSPGHRSNILSPNYNQIGVGLAIDSAGRPYWTQMFIKSY